MHTRAWTAGVLLLFLAAIAAPIVWGATTAKTTFVFYVATSRSITATYGGTCTSSAFFFNEVDANYDPDTDGNGAKVRPAPQRRGLTTTDYNYIDVTSPSATHMASGGFVVDKPTGDNNSPTGEINNVGYGNLEADDAGYVTRETSTEGQYPAVRLTFKSLVHPSRVRDLNFFSKGNSTKTTNPIVCTGGATAAAYDFNTYIWNYRLGRYDVLDGNSGGGATLAADGQVISAVASSKVKNAIVSDYISTSDLNITVLIVGERATDGTSCLTVDVASMKVTHVPEASDFCQSSTLSPLTITNAGNVDINVDANFSGAFAGTDYNAVLKVWQGSAGCGSDANGMGGWQQDCTYYSPVDVNTAPNTTSCRQYFKAQAAQYGRVITQLTAESAQQLCFSGDFNGFVPAGDHNNTFNACVGSECSSDVTDSMLGWWKFNDGSGTNLNDSTIYNNDGTLANTPTWLSGSACAGGGCLDFNSAQSEYVSFPIGVDFNYGNFDATTIAFWLKDDLPAHAPHYVMGIGSDVDARPFNVGVTNTANKLEIGLQTESGYTTKGFWGDDTNLMEDGWHHYAIAYNTNDFDANLYVDGVLTTTYGQGAISGLLQVSGTAALFFGTWDDGTGSPQTKYLDGRLDDVRLYSRTLTPAEIRAVVAHPQ